MSGVWGFSCVCRRWVSRKGNGFVRLWMCCGPFFVVGVPFCGMCMDLTNAFLRGRCNDFVMAWTGSVVFSCQAKHFMHKSLRNDGRGGIWWHLRLLPRFHCELHEKTCLRWDFWMRQLQCVRGVDFVAGPLLCGVLVVVFAIAIVPFGVVTAVPLGVCSQRCSHRCAYKNLKGSAQFLGGVYLRCRPVIAVPIGICTLSMFSKSWRDLSNSMAQCNWAQSLLCV